MSGSSLMFDTDGVARKYQRAPKRLSKSNACDGYLLRDAVNRALWKSFPECSSEEEVSEAARAYFRNERTGEPISARTIRYWLQGDTLPGAVHLSTLVMMQPRLFMSFWFGSES